MSLRWIPRSAARVTASIEGLIDSNNNRFSNAVYMYTHALLYRVGRSPTWDLQLEQLHRGESLTSFDRETGPYHGSYARFMSPAHPASKFYVTFTPRNLYFVLLTSLLCVPYLYNYRFAKDVSCEYLITLDYHSTLMVFWSLVTICDLSYFYIYFRNIHVYMCIFYN